MLQVTQIDLSKGVRTSLSPCVVISDRLGNPIVLILELSDGNGGTTGCTAVYHAGDPEFKSMLRQVNFPAEPLEVRQI